MHVPQPSAHALRSFAACSGPRCSVQPGQAQRKPQVQPVPASEDRVLIGGMIAKEGIGSKFSPGDSLLLIWIGGRSGPGDSNDVLLGVAVVSTKLNLVRLLVLGWVVGMSGREEGRFGLSARDEVLCEELPIGSL